LKPQKIVVIGASAGGIEALQTILGGLDQQMSAAVLIVLHIHAAGGQYLAQIFQRSCALPVRDAVDGDELRSGEVYLAPADYHLTVEDGHVRVLQGPRENRTRPAIDPLFRTAARYYGPNVIGVILTGMLDDGALGLMMVDSLGGKTIVHDPATATFSSMPKAALEQVPQATVLPLEKIAAEIMRLSSVPASRVKPATQQSVSQLIQDAPRGQPSQFACPDCGGVLWEMEDNGFLHFRCRVGHAFTARHLDAEQRHAVESALWSGLRALEESASLYRRMAERAAGSSRNATAEKFDERATNSEKNADILREFLVEVNRFVEA
jgi:two-component system chemotaxis response regulator CheB